LPDLVRGAGNCTKFFGGVTGAADRRDPPRRDCRTGGCRLNGITAARVVDRPTGRCGKLTNRLLLLLRAAPTG
jgi:hypothetical protein